VQIPPSRGLAIDLVENDEFLMTVARRALADDPAFQHVKGSKQCRCAVTFVVVGHRPATALLHRQSRLGTVECLDLRLLVNRQHERVRRSTRGRK
jgi:hypothetical protein